MKLGVSYNIFDGEELLKFSLLSIRELAAHISVVYQNISNFGKENKNLLPLLLKLQDEGLIDKLFEFNPSFTKNKNGSINWRSGSINELEKREIGLKIAKANNCDFFMTMDADEIYDTNQLQFALDTFEIGGYDSSFCEMATFYKLPTLEITDIIPNSITENYEGSLSTLKVVEQSDEIKFDDVSKSITFKRNGKVWYDTSDLEKNFINSDTIANLINKKESISTGYVPLFYKIKKTSKMGVTTNGEYPVKCDPTRKMLAGYCKIFTKDEIQMYHYSYVRKNIESKIYNSSAQSDKKNQKIVIDHFNNWKNIEDGAKFIGGYNFKLKEVENKFNILI